MLTNVFRYPVAVFVTFSVNKSENIRKAAFNLRLAARQRRTDGELTSAKKLQEEIQKKRDEILNYRQLMKQEPQQGLKKKRMEFAKKRDSKDEKK